MVLIRRKRKSSVRPAKRKSVKMVRRASARRRKARKNPRFGKHRPTLLYTRSGWKRPKRSKIKRAFRVNPKRRRNPMFKTRRNPLSVKALFSSANINQMVAVAGGLTVGLLGIPALYKITPLAAHRKYLGGIHILLGLATVVMSKKSAVHTAGMTVAAVGLYDLISQNVPVGLPTISEYAAILPAASSVSAPTAALPEPQSADFMPMAADFMSADYDGIGGPLNELTF